MSLDALPQDIAAAVNSFWMISLSRENAGSSGYSSKGAPSEYSTGRLFNRHKNAQAIMQNLQKVSANAHTCSLYSLGTDLVSDSCRVALAIDDSFRLLDVNILRSKVTVLVKHVHGESKTECLCAAPFFEITIVAYTNRLQYYALHISLSGGLDVATEAPRRDRLRRSGNKSAAHGPASGISWLLVVYSSFVT